MKPIIVEGLIHKLIYMREITDENALISSIEATMILNITNRHLKYLKQHGKITPIITKPSLLWFRYKDIIDLSTKLSHKKKR